MSKFKEYIQHGWVLVPILPGHKGPSGVAAKGWNRRDKCVDDPNHDMHSAGLAHAYSGTCAIDVDNYPVAAEWLAERGVDLDSLFADPQAVQISSGRLNRGKLIYALPEPLQSKKVAQDENRRDALDFRCATTTGLTVQDVLPPSIHPETGEPYKWVYDEMLVDWQSLPALPSELHKIWTDELTAVADATHVPEKGAAPDELRELLKHQDPDMSREDWVRVGMAIHHETDGSHEGLMLWDEWSQGSPTKYQGVQSLEVCWRSFHDTPNAITVGALRQSAVATEAEFPHIKDSTPTDDDPWAVLAQQQRDKFKLVQVGVIADRDPPEWLVDGLVPEADLAMIYGPRGSGKSFVALDLAFSVATGFTWFNMKSKAGPVVWIAAEAAGAMRNRARAYGQARGVKLENADLWVIEQALSLMNDVDGDALAHAMAEKAPALIIVDTLAAASGGANENSGEDMNAVLANCRKLHDATGALVMLIHHSGKDESRGARGWSGLGAAVRAEFSIEYNPNSTVRVMNVTKQSEGVEGDKLPFKLQVVPIDMEGTTSCVIEPLDASVIDGAAKKKLGGVQATLFDEIYRLAGEIEGEDGPVKIQDAYDATMVQLPPPNNDERDRRSESMRRALATLHEKGYVTVYKDQVLIGSAINETDESEEAPLSEV